MLASEVKYASHVALWLWWSSSLARFFAWDVVNYNIRRASRIKQIDPRLFRHSLTIVRLEAVAFTRIVYRYKDVLQAEFGDASHETVHRTALLLSRAVLWVVG